MLVPTLDPALRAGWEPDTPLADTLLRRFLVNWVTAIEAEGVPLGGRVLRRDDLAAVDVGRPALGGNVATLLAPLAADRLADVMAGLNGFYAFANGVTTGSVYLFSPWPTPDLRPFGWTLLDFQPLMLRPPGGEAPSLPPGLRIEAVRDEAGLRGFETALLRGFAVPELMDQGSGAAFSPATLGDDRLCRWVGWEGNVPVSAAATFIDAGINNVTLAATVPEARRRGYGAALTWRATLADPTRPSMLLATDEGRAVYERIGYMALFRFTIWHRDRPAGDPVNP